VNGKQSHELWAEAIRDIGILLMVFAPLDTIIKSGYGTWLDWLIASGLEVLGVALLSVGVRIGSKP
jgi:hypothetical protein